MAPPFRPRRAGPWTPRLLKPDEAGARGASGKSGATEGSGATLDVPLYFRLFNEIGIIAQLTTTVLERHLPDGLLEPHFRVLNHLARVGDGRTMQSMAAAFQIPKTTVSHQVSVLLRHDLVRVAPNPDDGRSKRVWLTDAGRRLREGVILGFGDVVNEWSRTITPQEVADLVPRLERIRTFLDADRDRPSD